MPAKAVIRRVQSQQAGRGNRVLVKPELPRYSLEPLNPWLICGPDTTVTDLWKVRERSGPETVFHLVYHDRYGWYCEHGRRCPAVPEARRAARELAEISKSVRRSAKARRKRRK